MTKTKYVVLLATHDFGGAGESAYRIAIGLRDIGYEVVLLVKQKTKSDDFIIQVNEKPALIKSPTTRIWQKFSNKINNLNKNKFVEVDLKTDPNFCFFNMYESTGMRDIASVTDSIPFKPDLILACWVSGFINTHNMRMLGVVTDAPIYWLTTDMAPMTGGCHYAWDCLGYTKDCSECPAVLTSELKQIAKQNLSIKKENIHSGAIRVLAHSEWCRQQALNSSLFKNQHDIHLLNGYIDKNVFNANCRAIAKQVFGIKASDKVIFTGATFTKESRKGISYLVSALQLLYKQLSISEQGSIRVMIAGNHVLDNKLVQEIPLSITPINFIKDERLLSLAYQAADVFVCSSIEDSGPAMVNEALACGTPVVGFNLGFVSDPNILKHGKNGFCVPMKNVELMTKYIKQVLYLSSEEANEFSTQAVLAIDESVSLNNLRCVFEKLF